MPQRIIVEKNRGHFIHLQNIAAVNNIERIGMNLSLLHKIHAYSVYVVHSYYILRVNEMTSIFFHNNRLWH